jgi:FAD/FMN-containing dehydrogenase
MILLDGSNEPEVMALAEAVSGICLSHGVIDVFVADSKAGQAEILAIRSGICGAMRHAMIKILDIAVPPAQIAEFADGIAAVERESGMRLPAHGHAADGNVPTRLMRRRWKDGRRTEIEGWRENYPTTRILVNFRGKSHDKHL